MKTNILRKYIKAKYFIINHQNLFAIAFILLMIGGVSFKQILDKTVKKRSKPIEYIVVHYTANEHPKADAEANAKYLRNKESAGTHYCVDDEQIIQCTDENNVAYSVGDRKWAGFIAKPWLKNRIYNNNSLSIEMCLGGGRNDSLIIERTASICAWQLNDKKLFMVDSNLNILPDLARIVRHHDVTGKQCPRFYYNDSKWNQDKEDRAFYLFKLKVDRYFRAIIATRIIERDSFTLNRNYEVSDFSNR